MDETYEGRMLSVMRHLGEGEKEIKELLAMPPGGISIPTEDGTNSWPELRETLEHVAWQLHLMREATVGLCPANVRRAC